MTSTSDLLINCILTGCNITDMHPAVVCDYFGINDESSVNIIYGIYEGLIKYKGVSNKLLKNCYMTNRLDELIHAKYTHHKSRYYVEFCNKHIKIGNTYFTKNSDNIESLNILTDDYCTTCNADGYYTKHNCKLSYPSAITSECSAPPDCFQCGNVMCKMCSNYDKKEESFICYMCENPTIFASIATKLNGYRKTDIQKFGTVGNITKDDVVALLNKQKFRCYVCDDIVLTFGWRPSCLYQFSIDRINNSLPHNRDNVLISCYYCNCLEYLTYALNCGENAKNKICDNHCHSEKRNISIKRTDVSVDKINALKLV